MQQKICDHCGHPSVDGWAEIHLAYMGKDLVIDVCPTCLVKARRMLADFAVFTPGLFNKKELGG